MIRAGFTQCTIVLVLYYLQYTYPCTVKRINQLIYTHRNQAKAILISTLQYTCLYAYTHTLTGLKLYEVSTEAIILLAGSDSELCRLARVYVPHNRSRMKICIQIQWSKQPWSCNLFPFDERVMGSNSYHGLHELAGQMPSFEQQWLLNPHHGTGGQI